MSFENNTNIPTLVCSARVYFPRFRGRKKRKNLLLGDVFATEQNESRINYPRTIDSITANISTTSSRPSDNTEMLNLEKPKNTISREVFRFPHKHASFCYKTGQFGRQMELKF